MPLDETQRRILQRLKDDFEHYAPRCLRIRTKSGQILPFTLNKAQAYIHARIEQQRRELGYVRAIVLKGRQQGCSTYIEGRFYWKVTHRFGVRAFILTHEDEATKNLFEMARRYYDNCPDVMRPQTEASNARELVFAELDSGYRLGTAGNKAVGRSSTIQYLHGCLAEGTLVYDPMTGGVRPIESFMLNDLILTHTRKIAPISFISSQEKECLSVSMRGLTKFPLIATPEHEFFTKDGWKELKKLKIGDSIGYPIQKIDNIYDEIMLPEPLKRAHGGGRQFICPDSIPVSYELGRIIGLYLTEGHVKLQHTVPFQPCNVSFAVHRNEVARTVEWLQFFSEYFSSIKIFDRKNSLASVVTVYGNRFATLMNKLCGRVETKHCPISWHLYGEEFCRGILHGYMSGDGGSYANNRKIIATSIRSAITISMRDIAAALGYGWASINHKIAAIRSGRNEKEAFIFELCGDGATKLAHEIGKPSPIRQRFKTTSIKNYAANTTEISDGYAWIRIKEITPVGMKKVYDFEVNHDDHSYCIINGSSSNSEVAYWANAAEHAKGIFQAVPHERDTEIILESTANGVGNYFHEQWQLAESGQSEFIPIFVPWYWQDEYVFPLPADFTVTDDEKDLKQYYGLTDEQLMWRRVKINELSVGGVDGSKAFMSEYPNTATEAFISTGEDTFINAASVMRARKTEVEPIGPLLIGVDPARFGDDRTCIIMRQGRKIFGLKSYAKKDTMEISGIVHKLIDDNRPSKVFVDVVGIGAGVVDRLNELGHRDVVVAVNGGSRPLDANRYINKRAEMWGVMREWLADEPVQIPDSDELHSDLCGLTWKVDSKYRIALEKKEDMKKRGLRSPDTADAMALTFALPSKAVLQTIDKHYSSVAQSFARVFTNIDKLKKAAYKH